MKKILTILLLICCSSIFAQNEFKFEFDYAQFSFDSSSNYVEIYYSFNQEALTLQDDGNTSYVSALLKISIEDSLTGEKVMNKTWQVNNPVSEASEKQTSLLGQLGFSLPKGTYSCIVNGSDAVDTTKFQTYNEKMRIKPIPSHKFAISDIQLASNIKSDQADKNSIFYKNTMEVVPNPTCFYSETLPVMFYYAELYNLNLEKQNERLELQKLLYNGSGKLIYKTVKPISRNKKSIVEAGTLSLPKYPTDTYTFVLFLKDTSSDAGVASLKKMYFYNPKVVKEAELTSSSLGYTSSEFGVFNEEDCDLLADQSKYIAVEKEIDQYKNLTALDAKRKFLFDFWKKRDPSPNTPQNEYKNEYLSRVKYADEKFNTMNRDGYKTDRGRILLMFGIPDQIDRYPNETNLKPYEVWSYNSIEGGVVFIFGDITGFSDYDLIHSTKRGELRDDNWQRRIQAI